MRDHGGAGKRERQRQSGRRCHQGAQIDARTQLDEEERHEESVGQAGELNRQAIGFAKPHQDHTGQESGDQRARAGTLRDGRQTDEHEDGQPRLHRPAAGS